MKLLFYVLLSLVWQLPYVRAIGNATRNYDPTLLVVSNGGKYGYWAVSGEFCPENTFASGYSLKIEENQFTGDDTALNAIRLHCSDVHGHTEGDTITSTEGPFGSWSKVETCNQHFNDASFLTSFQLQVEGPQNSGDDTSANFIKFQCRDQHGNETELVLPPGRGHWGSYGSWSNSCNDGWAICGLITKVEGVQSEGDDTALNDVEFYCCEVEYQHPQVVG